MKSITSYKKNQVKSSKHDDVIQFMSISLCDTLYVIAPIVQTHLQVHRLVQTAVSWRAHVQYDRHLYVYDPHDQHIGPICACIPGREHGGWGLAIYRGSSVLGSGAGETLCMLLQTECSGWTREVPHWTVALDVHNYPGEDKNKYKYLSSFITHIFYIELIDWMNGLSLFLTSFRLHTTKGMLIFVCVVADTAIVCFRARVWPVLLNLGTHTGYWFQVPSISNVRLIMTIDTSISIELNFQTWLCSIIFMLHFIWSCLPLVPHEHEPSYCWRPATYAI